MHARQEIRIQQGQLYNDGKLSYDEAFAVAEKLVGEELDREVFSNAFKLADINGNGTLQLYEFSRWFYQIDNSESLSE